MSPLAWLEKFPDAVAQRPLVSLCLGVALSCNHGGKANQADSGASTPALEPANTASERQAGPGDSGADAGRGERDAGNGGASNRGAPARGTASPFGGGGGVSGNAADSGTGGAAGGAPAMPDAAIGEKTPDAEASASGASADATLPEPDPEAWDAEASAPTPCDAGGCTPPGAVDDGEDADAGCVPLEAVEGATVGSCYPSCVTELEAACPTVGECGFALTASGSFLSCWQEGIQMSQASDASGSISDVLVGGELCYRVELLELGGTYRWLNRCGVVVAEGVRLEDPAQTAITCVESGEEHIVDHNSEACDRYDNGVPSMSSCAFDESCSL